MQTGCPGEQFVGKFFLKKYKTFQYFPIVSENISDFWRKNFGWLVKNAIWVSRRTFWGQTISGMNICSFWSFLDFEAVFFENFEVTTSARLSSLRNICPGEECEQKFFFLEKLFFVIFVFWLKKLAFLAKRNSAGSSYLHSRYPEERTEEKNTFSKNLIFKSFSYLNREEFWLLGEKKISWFIKIAFHVSRGTFWGILHGKNM